MGKSTREIILELAARPGGMRNEDAAGRRTDQARITTKTANSMTSKLVERGILFRGPLKRGYTRYFITAAARDAYLLENGVKPAPPPATKAKVERKFTVIPHRIRAHWGPDEPVDMSRAVVTQGPNFTPRYEAINYPGILGCQRGRAK